jgi:TATA-box binding protein (TBP) (component of TFIID and TFIIIB)
MKIAIESMVAHQNYKGDLDLREAQVQIKGSRFQPEVFKGLLFDLEQPRCKAFIMEDHTIRVHGVKSVDSANMAMDRILEPLKRAGLMIAKNGPLEIKEVVASHDMGTPLDPSKVLGIFKNDRLLYDPRVIPGFILKVPSTPMEVLIFPEGKLIVRGAGSIEDSASTLQMVAQRLEGARKG